MVGVPLIDDPLKVHSLLGHSYLNPEILATIVRDSFAEESEGLKGHHSGLGVGVGPHISTTDSAPALRGAANQHHGKLLPVGWTCQHLG